MKRLKENIVIEDISELMPEDVSGREAIIHMEIALFRIALCKAYDLFEAATQIENLDSLYPYEQTWSVAPIGYRDDPIYTLKITKIQAEDQEYSVMVTINGES